MPQGERERETSETSNLSPSRKEGGKHPCHRERERERETSETSNLSPSRKEGGKHPCHRERERERLARHLT